jgi:hypothetical protein
VNTLDPVWAGLFDTLERPWQLVAAVVSNRLLPSFGHHRGGSSLYDQGSRRQVVL